jgi:nucleotide-binding universal stress UspA family protein
MHRGYRNFSADCIKKINGQRAVNDFEIKAGDPTKSICNLLGHKNKIDLIIMSVVNANGLKIGKMLGSVTNHLSRTVPMRVLLIRPQDRPRIESQARLINRILIPQDGSKLSKLALPVGEELAAKLNIPITLFQMANRLLIYNYGYGIGFGVGYGGCIDYGKFNEVIKIQANDEMNILQNELKKKGLDVSYRVTAGTNVTGEIIKVGREVGADLIIMSTHGRSGLNRWAVGSVTEGVLRYGDMPLLLVHASAG